ncbi:hypothetical protein EHQ92_16605 [Leptospira biflexa]|jgi:elongation factor P hydroxylase|uniref:Uncharacterized protein n=2 Tax=Leptospira biflexa TaxID=172 RepID=B0SMU9_LEPBP|nr:hypothetical protein [Leptospira biflexa]ABZ95143.1 Hypothetical protein LBF_2661 [Leptospira biflexa serovar Patoc strain 'Patoc 1 (Ames)']ABZ98823.1 Hypothetical protein LEPBI_I2745 [Leptospira biflexa serovar Patoc strain 'Patoc 1 (Paris)']TGM34857.1 hypothetical protein EHQ80_13985 [Leptospira biflexa]TGM42250.1 hypothetical protein EHQ89_00060 [Leptospira biflexa]TGM42412.1 hypothetical protein EHQ92_16605 [Leptospira biflexa]
MSVSDRQMKLIKEAAELLIMEHRLTTDDAVIVISSALKKELSARNTSFEKLEKGSKIDRTSFIRSVVKHVQISLESNPYWRTQNLDKSIENFYQVLHKQWD